MHSSVMNSLHWNKSVFYKFIYSLTTDVNFYLLNILVSSSALKNYYALNLVVKTLFFTHSHK